MCVDKKGPNMFRRGRGCLSKYLSLNTSRALGGCIYIQERGTEASAVKVELQNLSHNTFAPYHWPQPPVLFIQGEQSTTTYITSMYCTRGECIKAGDVSLILSRLGGGYHGSIGPPPLKCATTDQNQARQCPLYPADPALHILIRLNKIWIQ